MPKASGHPRITFDVFDVLHFAIGGAAIVFTGASSGGLGGHAKAAGTLIKVVHRGETLLTGRTTAQIEIDHDRAMHRG